MGDSAFRGVMKGGWHPKGKDGGKESWRGDFKGIEQVAGWVGKGKRSDGEAAQEHVSRPLATLKDPSSFGPPPKNVNYHGGAALPDEITPHRSGLGAPLSTAQIESANRAVHTPPEEQEEQEEQAKRAPPALPYRADRTGLNTTHLPPPPVHRHVANSDVAVDGLPAKSKPGLPPRLPSRQNTASPVSATSSFPQSPPSYDSVAQSTSTRSAVSRLGNAGVSVPDFGIGKSRSSSNTGSEVNPWKNEAGQGRHAPVSPAPATTGNQLSELQQRFSRMKTTSDVQASPPTLDLNAQQRVSSPVSGSQASPMPSWQQSHGAFKTAQNLRNNPSSVSVADAKSAAETARQAQTSVSAFRERHADSIASAQAKAKELDQRYRVTSKVNKFLDERSEADQAQQHQQQHLPSYPFNQRAQSVPVQASPELTASISRKPPPPPPPKKPASMQAPPPVPVGTKPSFA